MTEKKPSLRIYLAGPSAELARVRAVADALSADGHVITEPWWERVADAQARGWATDRDVPLAYLAESWRRNRAGIESCALLIALCRSDGGMSQGVACEVAYALACPDAPEVLVCGDPGAALVATDRRVYIASSSSVEAVLAAVHAPASALVRGLS